jgi:hypothetical protein
MASLSNLRAKRRKRAKWLAKGLCGQCGKFKPSKGRESCNKCSNYQKQWKENRKKCQKKLLMY